MSKWYLFLWPASDHRYQNGTANGLQPHHLHPNDNQNDIKLTPNLKNFDTTIPKPEPITTIVPPTTTTPPATEEEKNDNNNNNNNNAGTNKWKRVTATRRPRSASRKSPERTTSPRGRSKRVLQRNKVNVKHSSAGEFDAKQVKRFLFIQSRIYLLSSLIGHRQAPYNSRKGMFGLMLWIMNLTIHFALDFYEAKTVFHFSWASSIGVFLVMFLICTVFLIRHTLRWFVKTLKRLSKDKIYDNTFQKLFFVFKVRILAPFYKDIFVTYTCGMYHVPVSIHVRMQRVCFTINTLRSLHYYDLMES